MNKIRNITALVVLLSLAATGFAQTNPPDPSTDPNSTGTPLGGTAPIGEGIVLLGIMAGAYAVGKTYVLRKI